MLLEEYFKPHQEEITKVDDKHGTENILPKAEISKKNSSPPFQAKALEQIPYFLKRRNWNCHIVGLHLWFTSIDHQCRMKKAHTRETHLWIQHKSFVPIGTVKMMCKTINSFCFSVFVKLWTALYTEKQGVEKFSAAHNQSIEDEGHNLNY